MHELLKYTSLSRVNKSFTPCFEVDGCYENIISTLRKMSELKIARNQIHRLVSLLSTT